MSFKSVYIPKCTQCNKEAPYCYSKEIPENWIGTISDHDLEIKYMYGEEGVTGEKSKTISSSVYITKEALFCSFFCYEKYMSFRISSMKKVGNGGSNDNERG